MLTLCPRAYARGYQITPPCGAKIGIKLAHSVILFDFKFLSERDLSTLLEFTIA